MSNTLVQNLQNPPTTVDGRIAVWDGTSGLSIKNGSHTIQDLLDLIAAGGGVSDHGDLTGLSDDDHTQYALLAGRTGGQTFYGGNASGNNLIIDSTSNATKGDLTLGQSYKQFSTGKITLGDITQGAPASTMMIAFKTTSANPYISFENSAGQRWILAAESSQLQFNRQANDLVGFYLDTSNRFGTGDGGSTFMASFKNAGSTSTTPGTAASGDAVISIRNRNSTNNNFCGLVFENQATHWGAGIFGVNENHTTSPTSHLQFWTSDGGTKAEAFRITAAGLLQNKISANESTATLGNAAATEYLKVLLNGGGTRYIPLVTSPN